MPLGPKQRAICHNSQPVPLPSLIHCRRSVAFFILNIHNECLNRPLAAERRATPSSCSPSRCLFRASWRSASGASAGLSPATPCHVIIFHSSVSPPTPAQGGLEVGAAWPSRLRCIVRARGRGEGGLGSVLHNKTQAAAKRLALSSVTGLYTPRLRAHVSGPLRHTMRTCICTSNLATLQCCNIFYVCFRKLNLNIF